MAKASVTSTSAPMSADHKILSTPRTPDGKSEGATRIPAVDQDADGRIDNVHKVSKESRPPARTTRRGFLMSTMATAASLATAPAIANLPVTASTLAPSSPAPAITSAAHSPVAKVVQGQADVDLLALAEQYVAIEQKYCDLCSLVGRMEDDFRRVGQRGRMPEILRWRDRDAELGLPSLYSKPDDHPPMWDRPCDVDKLRDAKWSVCSKTETDDELTVTVRKVAPSPAARARADEIIAAYDEWSKEGKPPRGYRKAVRERDKACRAFTRLENQIAEMRATTLEGMLAKIRCAVAYAKTEDVDGYDLAGADECPALMAMSILKDVQKLAMGV